MFRQDALTIRHRNVSFVEIFRQPIDVEFKTISIGRNGSDFMASGINWNLPINPGAGRWKQSHIRNFVRTTRNKYRTRYHHRDNNITKTLDNAGVIPLKNW